MIFEILHRDGKLSTSYISRDGVAPKRVTLNASPKSWEVTSSNGGVYITSVNAAQVACIANEPEPERRILILTLISQAAESKEFYRKLTLEKDGKLRIQFTPPANGDG